MSPGGTPRYCGDRISPSMQASNLLSCATASDNLDDDNGGIKLCVIGVADGIGACCNGDYGDGLNVIRLCSGDYCSHGSDML